MIPGTQQTVSSTADVPFAPVSATPQTVQPTPITPFTVISSDIKPNLSSGMCPLHSEGCICSHSQHQRLAAHLNEAHVPTWTENFVRNHYIEFILSTGSKMARCGCRRFYPRTQHGRKTHRGEPMNCPVMAENDSWADGGKQYHGRTGGPAHGAARRGITRWRCRWKGHRREAIQDRQLRVQGRRRRSLLSLQGIPGHLIEQGPSRCAIKGADSDCPHSNSNCWSRGRLYMYRLYRLYLQ